MNRDTVLFSDSKGEGLRELIPDFVGNKFRILSGKGATVYNKRHVNSLLRLVKELKDPIILVWLGTCEITRKVDKYIKLYKYPYQNIEFILTEYRKLRYQIRRKNPSASLYFIECPCYSITKSNKPKNIVVNSTINLGKVNERYPSLIVNKIREVREIQWAAKVDKEVSTQIDYYNDHLKLLNRGISTPRLSQDIIVSNKSRVDPRVKYKKNYNLMHDGVHPIRTLAKLWAVKLVETALELSEEGC